VTVAGHRHQGIFSYRANHINAASSLLGESFKARWFRWAGGDYHCGLCPSSDGRGGRRHMVCACCRATDTAHLFFALDCNSWLLHNRITSRPALQPVSRSWWLQAVRVGSLQISWPRRFPPKS